MAGKQQTDGGTGHSRNPYSRGGGSAWARNSQGARANAVRSRSGRGMTQETTVALQQGDALDRKFGFYLLPELLEQEAEEEEAEARKRASMDDSAKLGWLLNLRACTLPDPMDGNKSAVSGVELYFLEQDGKRFKTRIIYPPYFYVRPEANRSQDVIGYCLRRFEGLVVKAERVFKEDLDVGNHLNGKKALYVKLSFATVADLMTVKKALMPVVTRNQAQLQARQAYELQGNQQADKTAFEPLLTAESDRATGLDENESALLELREFDVPYTMRVAIDLDIRVGAWYLVSYDASAPYTPSNVTRQHEMVDKAEPVVCAFDIECTKAPLKFPDAQVDQIYMISYMIDRQGYLIVNRDVVADEIPDFEYTPKAAYPGPFRVFNEATEADLLDRFVTHLVDVQPQIFVTYNGDFFDWPFLETRALIHGINVAQELGISLDERSGEYRGRCSVHLDAFCWVKRDSYLPQGSQGLKAVTKYKLGYDPVEVDAEDMVALARHEPLKMASYSVSDAVATFYLYEKYVHLFVFSLCTIIPLGSEDVLRKGSGTLCEALLMVEAYHGNIICPNKQSAARQETFYKGHLVENETYVGGHVECLESGVFRADFLYDFHLVSSALQQLMDHLDRDLAFAIAKELNVTMDQVVNYHDVKETIWNALRDLRDHPNRKEKPLIYHLDVAAMYPNIILTNRLQPCAIVNEADCAACAFNTECGQAAGKGKEESCQREMEWVWRGDFYPATRPEYHSIKTQLAYESFPVEKNAAMSRKNVAAAWKSSKSGARTVPFAQLGVDKQQQVLKDRLKSYCSSVYKKVKVTEEQQRSATVCMRENPFYVNTVRAFRDRRYEYKELTKVWKQNVAIATKANDLMAKTEAQNKCLVYDSLQLAHKCILNSFYGYVMRKGARWHSMEMAGIVTHTGSSIITRARQLVEQLGRPLELDTDGIWAIFPHSFPETFTFKLQDGTFRTLSYPCVMLNADVHAKFTNPQYHELDPVTGTYRCRHECSILFEVDGPYKAMVLPASTEEGKLLKKRYAVFNMDNSLAELKGFELKRRGELQLIKAFQSQVFERFLDGETLEECYASVATCANRWLDVLDTRGEAMDDEELMALITENKSMSGKLDDYEGQKSTSITTARRLSEFLGDDMIKDKGLACKLIIAARPYGEKVTERAIPTAIFATEDAVKRHFLKKWLHDPQLQDFDLRSILDWEYYRQRFASTVQKIISLPAAFQNVPNPVPRIALPDWMRKQVREQTAKHQQGNLKQFLQQRRKEDGNDDVVAQLIDLEDLVKGKEIEKEEEEEEEEEDVEMGKLGDVPFPHWLQTRKKQWKKLLGKRRRAREEGHRELSSRWGSRLALKGNGVGMENFVVNAGTALQRESWQLVEIQAEPSGGVFTCWVVTAQSQMLERITLKMPRMFYLDCNDTAVLGFVPGARRVSRLVPHRGSSPRSIVEIKLSERQYQAYEKELSLILNDPAVHGVYERQVTALTRAVCALGCVAKVVNPHMSSSAYELKDLQFQSTAQAPYLVPNATSSGSSSLMRRVLLYCTQQKKRAIVGLMVLHDDKEEGKTHGDATVWCVDPFSTAPYRRNDLTARFELLREEIQREGLATWIHSCTFQQPTVVSTLDDAFAGVNATLARLASNKRLVPRPTIVVAQTCLGSSQRLREKMQGLHSFPLALLPWKKEDAVFPALTWRQVVSDRMLTRFIEMTAYYHDLVACARYAHLPVGNFTGDHAMAILDTLYARLLAKHKHLWWHSTTSLPDLGGQEHEQQLVSPSIRRPGAGVAGGGEAAVVAVCERGSFVDVCVEVELEGLAVNAILVAAQLDTIEGISTGTYQMEIDRDGNGKTAANAGGDCEAEESCGEAFRVLKVLVTTLLKDFMATRNTFADHVLQQVYRWLCSPASLSFDPALHALVKRLMEKLFLQLVAELRRLGASIVYADFTRLILCTHKTRVADARTYLTFVLQTVAANELFQVLHLRLTTFMAHVFFYDAENYGGVLLEKEEDKKMEEEEEEEEKPLEIFSHWNMARYLPRGVDDYFLLLVGQFIRRRAEFHRRRQKDTPMLSHEMEEQLLDEDERVQGTPLATYSQRLVSSYFSDKLLRLVPEIVATPLDRTSFPVFAGSHLDMDSPALELVKFVTAVFQLEPSVDVQVRKMKRTLLKLLHVSDFAAAAQFQNPSLSLIVPDVICLSCHLCRSIDLCRDPQLFCQSKGDENDDDEDATAWHCPRCYALYDKAALELRLVEMVQAQSLAYQVQDLYCQKCHLPAEHKMRDYCPCSGTYAFLPGVQEALGETLSVLKRVAEQHKFEWLLETVERLQLED